MKQTALGAPFPMEEATRVKPESMGFDELMLSIRNGNIRIPDFQREFVWDLNQITSLLDSIYNHYPIGSFLLWQTGDEIQSYRRVGEIELRTDNSDSVRFVLDGQQRLTSLFASLEQAKIAHRVNGRKVTKSVQVFFDLDRAEFVADPFNKNRMKKVWKRQVLEWVPGVDSYLPFLEQYLSFIDDEQPLSQEAVEWLEGWPEIAPSRAQSLFVQLADIGLYSYAEDRCRLKEHGLSFLEDCSPETLLNLLKAKTGYFDDLLPKLYEDGRADSIRLAKYLSKTTGENVDKYKAAARLRWLAGLGLGEFRDWQFELNSAGQEILGGLLRAIEIEERDKKEQEEEKKKRYFSLKQITDVSTFVEAAVELDPERRQELNRVLKRFTSYPFSVIHVLNQPIETACEIFERINNSGKILSVVDLMVAKSWTPTFNLRERLYEFREELRKERFEVIPDITVIHCLSAIVMRGARRKDILSIERSVVEENWEATLESIRKAIDFLRSNLKVENAKIIPYNMCLVPLSYYFSVVDEKAHDNQKRKELELWFWRASLSNRYEKAAETIVSEDIAEMRNLAAGEKVSFDYISPALSATRIAAQKLNLGSAFCKTLICALNQRKPKEFKDSTPVSLTSFSKFNSAELHHIFPKAYLKKFDPDNYPERDSMANIALARASANKAYSSKAPSRYLSEAKNPLLERVLPSHLIDDLDKSALLEDDFETFIGYRAERILQELRLLSGDMTEVEEELSDSELRAVERFELRLRDLIDRTLRSDDPEYWSKTSSPEFRQSIEGRIQMWLTETPGRSREDARELDFCQMFDYFKVIKAHWRVFESIFRSRSDLEQHFKIVAKFRNALAHNREIDEVTRQLTIGSLAWFDRAFSASEGLVAN